MKRREAAGVIPQVNLKWTQRHAGGNAEIHLMPWGHGVGAEDVFVEDGCPVDADIELFGVGALFEKEFDGTRDDAAAGEQVDAIGGFQDARHRRGCGDDPQA